MRKWFAPAVLAAVAAVSAAPASAAVTIYGNAAAFTAATNAVVTDGFNIATQNGRVSYSALGYTGVGFRITQTGTILEDVGRNFVPGNQYNYNGTSLMRFNAGGTITFSFLVPIKAFSIQLMSYAASPVNITVSGPGFSQVVSATNSRPGSTYFGMTSTTGFSYFTLQASSNIGLFDNLVIATPKTVLPPGVPEPATWISMILGMGAIGFAMRRRPRAGAGERCAA